MAELEGGRETEGAQKNSVVPSNDPTLAGIMSNDNLMIPSNDKEGGQESIGSAGEMMDPAAVRQVPLPGSRAGLLTRICSNYISTTKYSIYSFLPLGLLY